ncbi:MAG TPA: methylated-DNA--[protein]-cysteine S-methyltransferase [Caldilineae bacterium]|nr:methylated-DNA--[protein]-cysteine S-methyltransferase [Caldilineae bacterium]
MTNYAYLESPIGLIELGGTAEALTTVAFVAQRRSGAESNAVVDEARRQLAEYFAGERRGFDAPLALRGSEFQLAVWNQLLSIPFGQMVSYQDIADALGKPQAVRAVGAANGQNPIAIIVPCHRVVGSNGKLVGYGGGLWRKEWLLRHEGALLL